ncbi:MAG TPA: hypothetical protein VJ063_01755 [Verrucomicrobiae bacterium]|nr:hypothetical protein [Verrucomicrobiae bacterium]
MARPSDENLKTIRFDGELLPNCAQLLDLASRLCQMSDETRHWFSTFTNSNGVDDARTVLKHCELLRAELQAHRDQVLSQLRREQHDTRPDQIFGAWLYALDTMIQQASGKQTCSWFLEGLQRTNEDDLGDDGEITLRRV